MARDRNTHVERADAIYLRAMKEISRIAQIAINRLDSIDERVGGEGISYASRRADDISHIVQLDQVLYEIDAYAHAAQAD